MTKLDMRTPDFTNENIAQIAALFPNCVTEAKDDKVDSYASLLDIVNGR